MEARVRKPEKKHLAAIRSTTKNELRVIRADQARDGSFPDPHTFDVAIVGLGYVGLPLCLAFSNTGGKVLGLDVDEVKTNAIQAGKSYIKHIPSRAVSNAIQNEAFRASTDFSKASSAQAILICVPTPLTINRTPDLSYVEATAITLAPYLRRGQLVVLESTTYPGTTEEVVKPILEAGSGLKAGEDFYLAYSPEREDPGNPKSNFSDCPKVVGGMSSSCLERAKLLYEQIVNDVVPVSSCRAAEATKLMENIFRSVNIALVNELKVIYSQMGIDVWEVIQAASTKPFGYMPFYPGPGLGGHCIPIDPFYLTWKALEFGHHTRLIELAGEINTAMPDYVVSRVIDALNDSGKPVKESRVLILGIAYKADVDDDRESPSYVIMQALEKRGAFVSYNDPHVPVIQPGRSHHAEAGKESVPISNNFDVILLCTNHKEYESFNFEALDVPLVDCRNASSNRPVRYYAA